MPVLLRSKDFAAHLHTVFRVETPLVLDLELTEVDDRSNDKLEQFSIVLQGRTNGVRGRLRTATHVCTPGL